MNIALLPEMLHCMNSPGNSAAVSGNCTDMTVLERQRARMKWQQEQVQQSSNNNTNPNEFINGLLYNNPDHPGQVSGFQAMMILGGLGGGGGEFPLNRAVKPDPGLENGWADLDRFVQLPGMGNYAASEGVAAGDQIPGAISQTSSCPPSVIPVTSDGRVSPEKIGSVVGKEGLKKRKANDKRQNTKVVNDDDSKRVKGSTEEESKITEQNNNNNKENSGETSKENSKVSEVQKLDYIHVRARRGQATDSHSLAERVRREKISERMKYLQDLVPGCNKITGKAGMLDEIINYVQSLQRQVEFLSMKLAVVNPRLDFNMDDLFAKEMYPSCSTGFQAMGVLPEITNSGNYLEFSPIQQVVSCGGLEMGLSSQDLALRRTISAPVSIPDQTFLDTSCYNQQIQPQITWDSELQNLFGPCPSQLSPFTGSIEAGYLKMEM